MTIHLHVHLHCVAHGTTPPPSVPPRDPAVNACTLNAHHARCKASFNAPCPCNVTFTGASPGCRQWLQIGVERDQWDGTALVSTLRVNGASVTTSYFPCRPAAGTTVGGGAMPPTTHPCPVLAAVRSNRGAALGLPYP
jgi:hypothetical protein